MRGRFGSRSRRTLARAHGPSLPRGSAGCTFGLFIALLRAGAWGGKWGCDGCSVDVAFGGRGGRCGGVCWCVCRWGVGGGAGVGVRSDGGGSGGGVRWDGRGPFVWGGDHGGARADVYRFGGGGRQADGA